MSNQFKRFLPFELSGDIVHVEKSGMSRKTAFDVIGTG
jgi:hypothetical protein